MTAVAGPPGTLLAGVTGVSAAALEPHVARLGPPPVGGAWTIAALQQVVLRGRGGAGFPAARKWQAVAQQARDGLAAVVIANGSEGEPCSRKDMLLLRSRPHLVLDGLRRARGAA